MTKNKHLSTTAIHGSQLRDAHGSPHQPIYNTTTFAFENTAALLDVIDGREKGALYTRYGMNPTIFALEETMAAIEAPRPRSLSPPGWRPNPRCSHPRTRRHRLHRRRLRRHHGVAVRPAPLLGINTTFLLGSELDRLEDALRTGAGLVFFETPTNPTLEVFDIAAISKLAHSHGALVAVDNTFASPVNQRPLELGADLVSYSATKYLGGHSDITAGFVLGSTELVTPVWNWRKNLGSTLAPETASLLSRSLRTLSVRVRAQNETAQAIARAMDADPRVSRVLYPGLPSFPGHALAARQMSGFGGVLTIEIAGDAAATTRVADRLRLFALAPSLGGTESLATQPVTTTHHGLSPEERARRGITDSMIRLSVGLEDADDLIADLKQALDDQT